MCADPSPVLHAKEQLVHHLEGGCKPPSAWRVGTEHEKFGFFRSDLRPLPYEGPGGIRAILEGVAQRFGWSEVWEHGHPIALEKGAAAITLEPGGQLELSGAPLETIHETQGEINDHLDQLAAVCRESEVAFVGVGAQPKWPFDRVPWMPKGRYGVMRGYLPAQGSLALDMMARTATVQANLDFGDEADMVLKFRVAMALQPLATALFANSPFIDGAPSGFLSYRARAWRATDPARCGWLPILFRGEFGFEKYVDWALEVPMFFFYREGVYREAGGYPFRLFFEGRHPLCPGERPTLADWELHLTTLFPDVRLKRFLEMRGADAGNTDTLCALPALWKGLLYDAEALGEAWELVAGWELGERGRIWEEVPRLALATAVPGHGTLGGLAGRVVELARQGLVRQNRRNADGCTEAVYLEWLQEVVNTGMTPAHRLLEAFRGRWGGSVDPLFHEEEFESFYAKCQ